MYLYFYTFVIVIAICAAQKIHIEDDVNFRVDPGQRTCFFEKAKAGQTIEVYYQVLDGQHGDLDISFELIDPEGKKLVSDYKKSDNSIIMDLELTGDYFVCLDNTYSMMNSKLVFISVLIEEKAGEGEGDEEGEEEGSSTVTGSEQGVLEWTGTDEAGEPYFMEVRVITESLARTLQHVMRARIALDKYAASKARDAYLAFEDTFIVDMWSAFQITFMFTVGVLQVYMIKSLFNRPVTVL